MLFCKVKTPGLAHVAYVLGRKGEAIVVDPRRDTDEYVALARAEGLRVRYVLETHRQEDFVMGSGELAKKLGAKVVTLDHPLFGHSDIKLADGEEIELAGVRIKALHTPGHTPESTCYAVYLDDSKAAWGVFSGDTLFIGETGRTDLPDREKTGENAALLYDAVRAKLGPLGDQAILWPAHASGSVCGGNIAERDDSTLGFERTYNPVFTEGRDAFIARKVRERIPRPPYFRTMEVWNLEGGRALAKQPGAVPVLAAKDFASEMKQGLVIDTREPEAFAAGHIPGSVNVWLDGLPVFAGWLATESTRVYLVLPRPDDLDEALKHLARVGIDAVEGTLASGFEGWRDAGMPLAMGDTIAPRELEASLDGHVVLDVRDDQEFEQEGHIPNARHLYVGYLDEHLDRIRKHLEGKATVAVTCNVGHRSGLALSLLERHGIRGVKNLLGGMTAWRKLKLPLEKGTAGSVTTPDVEGERR
ncbi:MAG: rhodanese-like domain-containing protein [Deltaproteobacteria bacterium]|nr:rhodanese-like domain-containing protein [Myxococcales bacterium]MDP3217233.1 rhodanese-like domain-containing protein [Deltaproteobacteria bacterium]